MDRAEKIHSKNIYGLFMRNQKGNEYFQVNNFVY